MRVKYLFILSILSICFITTVPNQVLAAKKVQTREVGVMLNLETQLGNDVLAALKLAAQRISLQRKKGVAPLKIKLIVNNTKGNTEKALLQLDALKAKGIHIVLGPQTDDVAQALIKPAKKKGMLLLSPTSSSILLAKAKDPLFRFVSDDHTQAKVLVKSLDAAGIKEIILVHQDDLAHSALAKAMRKELYAIKAVIKGTISYGAKETSFRPLIANIAKLLSPSIQKVGKEKACVLIIGDNGIEDILFEATQFRFLAQVRWFGSMPSAKSGFILKDKDARSFAGKTSYQVPLLTANSKHKLFKYIQRQLFYRLKHQPDTHAFIAYDLLQVVAKTLRKTEAENTKEFTAALVSAANSYKGLSGQLTLNKSGDRLKQSYEVRLVEQKLNRFRWKRAGKYFYDGEELRAQK
jgi:ABC-type branched-subunit amino acid transport system substrate-binding protein